MVLTVTTWNNPRVGFGTVLNQVQNVYNDFGQQTYSYQAHGGSVNTSTTPKVQYGYTNGTGNTIRMTGMTYPSGRVLTYGYGTANAINDACSRIESVSDSVTLATYQYLGASGFVNAASAEPGINWTLIGTGNDPATGDIYWGLDRFGRVDNCLWKKSTTTLAQIQYGYDRASNRTWRKDGVLTGYDELYSYDGLYRLIDQKRGTLNGTQTAITTGTFEQQWGLDATGNWKTFKQDNDGNGTWELNQTRTANKVNEITGVTNSVGTAWATPTYDGAGNMIGMPNPPVTITGTTPAWVPMTEAQWNTLTEAQWNAFTENTGTTPQQMSAQYDAWNRLVKISDGTNTVEHVYDARGYRIRKDTYTSGTLTEARHYYYTPGWQVVEERLGTSTNVERQFVWGLRYIDDLVLRDRDATGGGSINERRYAMQDGNWNTIAICDITGSVGERYAYSAYGSPVFMNGSGTVQTSSAIGFETLYAGYRWDGTNPQMYYVRNRFLLPMIGTWNRRDPIGYGRRARTPNAYAADLTLRATDPLGLFPQEGLIDRIDQSLQGILRTLEAQKQIPKDCQDRIKALPRGTCPIIIFAGHFVDPNQGHGIFLPYADELYGWYTELEILLGEIDPPNYLIGGTGCFHEELYEDLHERFPQHVLNKKDIVAKLPGGKNYRPRNDRLQEEYAPFTLAALLVEAQRRAKDLCRRGKCREVRIIVCCSKHFSEAVDNVEEHWPNMTPEQIANVKGLCDSQDRNSGGLRNVFSCQKK